VLAALTDSRLREDLGIDSLLATELLYEIEAAQGLAQNHRVLRIDSYRTVQAGRVPLSSGPVEVFCFDRRSNYW
jgi:hypothetical protein